MQWVHAWQRRPHLGQSFTAQAQLQEPQVQAEVQETQTQAEGQEPQAPLIYTTKSKDTKLLRFFVFVFWVDDYFYFVWTILKYYELFPGIFDVCMKEYMNFYIFKLLTKMPLVQKPQWT